MLYLENLHLIQWCQPCLAMYQFHLKFDTSYSGLGQRMQSWKAYR